MSKTVKHSIAIKATPERVWQALTDKEIIKQYMFGTETTSDWNEGSRIDFTGSYEGTEYKDGGIILKIVPEKILKYSYWSSMSGLEDIPENYATIIYTVEAGEDKTILTVEQADSPTEQMADNSDKHWPIVLGTIKKILEQ